MLIIPSAGVFAAAADPVYVTHMASASLSVGTYSIPRGGVDDQTPHAEDEIYVVVSGRSGFAGPWGRAQLGPGSVLFVPAGEEHRFVDITDDLTLLVIFAPPYSGEDLSVRPGSCYPCQPATLGPLELPAPPALPALPAQVLRRLHCLHFLHRLAPSCAVGGAVCGKRRVRIVAATARLWGVSSPCHPTPPGRRRS
jgi:mannose-6-phosphate isomerase-like protein (cupin superfamily)